MKLLLLSSILFGGDRITKLTLTKLIIYLPNDDKKFVLET